jgi:hypothetical protein
MIHRLYVEPPELPVRTALDGITDGSISGPTERRRLGILSSQYQAAILEAGDDESLLDNYYGALLSSKLDNEGRLKEVLNQIETELIDDKEGLAIAARTSPIGLTAFGRASVLTGLAARSCRRLVETVNRAGEDADAANPQFLADLVLTCSDMPEIEGSILRKVTKPKSRFLIKPADIQAVLESWLLGRELIEIFLGLPFVRNSKRSPSSLEWAAGIDTPTSWDGEFDDLMDYMSQVVSGYLPWLCRAIESLKRSTRHHWVHQTDWGLVASQLEHGVDTTWALAAIRSDCPSPRTVLGPFGRAAASRGGSAELGLLFPPGNLGREAEIWLNDTLIQVSEGKFGTVDDEQLRDLEQWMRRRIPVVGP